MNIRSVPGRPLKVIIHAMKAFDPARIAEQGIRDTLSIRPDDYNVVEFVEPRFYKRSSYTTAAKNDKLLIGSQGFLFEKRVTGKYGKLFSQTNDFIFMGGALNRCLWRAVTSVIAMKAADKGIDTAALFKEMSYFQKSAALAYHAGRRKRFAASFSSINIHLNSQAIYPDQSMSQVTSGDLYSYLIDKLPRTMWKEFASLAVGAVESPKFDDLVHADIFMKAPEVFRGTLGIDGIEVREYLDGCLAGTYVNGSGVMIVNMYYWSSTKNLADFLALHALKQA